MPRYSLRMETCPRCGAPRPAALVECPRCGVIYAKAEARAAVLEPSGPSAAEGVPEFEGGPALEVRIRTWAIPVALLCAWVLVSTGPGRAVVRIFFSMWVHELGHAAAAWLCGFLAVPGPWRTLTASGRSPVFAALLSAALIYAIVRSWLTGRRGPRSARPRRSCCSSLARCCPARGPRPR